MNPTAPDAAAIKGKRRNFRRLVRVFAGALLFCLLLALIPVGGRTLGSKVLRRLQYAPFCHARHRPLRAQITRHSVTIQAITQRAVLANPFAPRALSLHRWM